ncbi:MAG: response regulator transcription factor [Candidatus Didemnitutus sp.]|nr:response regulator transcription factor [Candidatus Didemnitutus sp.]
MTPTKRITVLLAEDHVVVRLGLRALLEADGHFIVVGEARTGREAVAMARVLQPDVIVMDIAMPVLNGLEATRQILAENPTARVLILSAHSDDEYIASMTAVGAQGFLEKQTSAEVLTAAIQEIAQGRSFYSPTIAKRLVRDKDRSRGQDGVTRSERNRLTQRESEVLQLVAEGHANKQIAVTLGISIKTVEKHRQHLMDKLNIHDTAGLTRHAISAGVIECTVKVTII